MLRSALPPSAWAGGGWTAASALVVLVLMVWDESWALKDRFANARRLHDGAVPRARRVPATYQGLVKAVRRLLTAALLERLESHLRTLVREASAGAWTVGGWVPLAIDGSRFECPRTARNLERFGRANRDGSGPQQTALVAWHAGSGLPWSWRLGAGTASEHDLLRALLPTLPKGCLLLLDAGFPHFELLREIVASGRHVLVRAASGVCLLRDLGWDPRRRKGVVHLWPQLFRRACPPLALRPIRVGTDRGEPVWVLTNVTDPAALSVKRAKRFYRMRWGIEVAYRGLKQTMERRKVRGHSPAVARTELESLMLGASLLGLAGAAARRREGRKRPAEGSFAGTLRAVRQAMRTDPTPRQLQRALASARDPYPRRKNRHGADWPHRKNPTPPRPPQVRDATPAERRLALELRAQLIAA
jgi:hypothetical protein